MSYSNVTNNHNKMFFRPKFIFLCIAVSFGLTVSAEQAPADSEGITEIVNPGAEDDEIYTVWTRIRNGFKIPEMKNRVVDDNLARYSKRPDYLQRMADRSQNYLYHIIEEVESRGLPTEIALLPLWKAPLSQTRNPEPKPQVYGSSCRQPAATTSLIKTCGRTRATMFCKAPRQL